MDIKKMVSSIKKKAKTDNIYELLDFYNINIIETDLGRNTLGMYRYVKRNKFIFINECLEHHEKRFVLAHEFGHAMLHSKFNCFFLEKNTLYVKNKFEIEADRFAAELLISDSSISELSEYTLEQTAAILEVPKRLVEYKLSRG